MTESLPPAVDALIANDLAKKLSARPDANRYGESVLAPLIRAIDPGASLDVDRGLDGEVAAASGLMPVTGCEVRWSHLIRGRADGLPYQLSWLTSDRNRFKRHVNYFNGLLAQGLLSRPLTGRTIVVSADKEILAEPSNRGMASVSLAGIEGVRAWSTHPEEGRQLITSALASALVAAQNASGHPVGVTFAADRVSVAWAVGALFEPPTNEAVAGTSADGESTVVGRRGDGDATVVARPSTLRPGDAEATTVARPATHDNAEATVVGRPSGDAATVVGRPRSAERAMVDGLKHVATTLIAIRHLLRTAAGTEPSADIGHAAHGTGTGAKGAPGTGTAAKPSPGPATEEVDVLFGDRSRTADRDQALAAAREKGLDARLDRQSLVLRFNAGGRIVAMLLLALPWPLLAAIVQGRASGWPGLDPLIDGIISLNPAVASGANWLVANAPWTSAALLLPALLVLMAAQRIPRRVVIGQDDVRFTSGLFARTVTTPLPEGARRVTITDGVVTLAGDGGTIALTPRLSASLAKDMARAAGNFTRAEVILPSEK